MAKKDRYIVGIDIGSTKTCALVCQPSSDSGKLEVAGLGVAESRGWRKGVIVNLDATVLSLKKAVEAAESSAGVPVDSAYVGVAGPHIKGVNSRGAVVLGGRPGGGAQEVTREDIRQVIQTARGISLPPDRSLIHVLPQEFLLDSQNGIRDPIGMMGSRLEVNVHVVMASASATQNIVTAVNRAGVVVRDTVFESLASAEACLTADERELGVALVDIGGGTSELIVFYQGTVRHTAAIPVGGDHFTNDVAVGLRTPIPEAEKMKRLWGDRDPARPAEDLIEVSSVGGRPTRVVSYAMMSEIIEPRALELLELLDEELARSGYGKQLGAGVVLAGGGAKLGGLQALAEQTLGLPVRVGKPTGLLKMGDVLPSPVFATVVGLVAFGNRMRLLRDSREHSWAGKLWSTLRGKAE
ncbi:MAG TPA: cell division protein FtsA [Terriglobia bacterium]|nr:cell division protein FtsA [Terriglobia bacterium]